MSDVEESNAEDNDDLESVPSPPPKELTKEDITGKLDDNSDPTVVIERYQNTAENEAADLVNRVENDTKGILELGDDIAKRRERIQADRERVVANQRRTADLLIKLK